MGQERKEQDLERAATEEDLELRDEDAADVKGGRPKGGEPPQYMEIKMEDIQISS